MILGLCDFVVELYGLVKKLGNRLFHLQAEQVKHPHVFTGEPGGRPRVVHPLVSVGMWL